MTLNDPVYVEAAQAFARRAVEASDTTEGRIRFAIQQALIRQPSAKEIQRLEQLYLDLRKAFAEDLAAANELATHPLVELSEGADVVEYAAWTVVCNAILNLDEMLMKR